MSPTRAADFGPLIVETDVDTAVIEYLALWLPTHIAEIKRERGVALATPAREAYDSVMADDQWRDNTLPAVLVTTASTTDEPVVDAEGNYYIAYAVIVSTVSQGRSPQEARLNACLLGGGVKRAVLGDPSLDGFAGDTRLIASRSGPLRDASGEGRNLAACITTFSVFVDKVVRVGAGPDTPDDPYDGNAPDPDTPYDDPVLVNVVTFDVDTSNP